MKHLFFLFGLGLLVLAGGCSGEQNSEAGTNASIKLRGAVVDPPRPITDFVLSATIGQDFRLSDQKGKVVLLYFGYMTCPDVCPNSTAELVRVYRELGEPSDQVMVVFVTVDPERDVLERLTIFMAAFHADFIGLRAESAKLHPILEEFGVQVTRQEQPDSALKYTMDHTASIFLIAPDGKLLEQFLYGTSYQDIAKDVALVLDAY